MMPFQHVAGPQDENLNYITGSVSLLWRALFHLRLLPSLFFFSSDSKRGKDRGERKDTVANERKKLERGGVKLDSKVGVE